MRHCLDFSHGGSSEPAQLTNPPPPHHIPATWGAPLFSVVCSVSSHCAVRSGQRQNQHQAGLLPAGAALSQIWRSRREDAFELQLPEFPQSFLSPTTHLPKYKMVSGLMAPSRWT